MAAAFFFALPSLAVGFFADDYILRAVLHHALPINPPWYDLYFFVPAGAEAHRAAMHLGEFTWWTAADLKVHLFRPLGSALIAFDEHVFGDAAAGWHLHSIAWYLALVIAVAGLYRRVLPRATGTVALFLFAMCESHVQPYGWPSSRHATVAAFAGVLALHAYLRDCDESWAPGRWLAALGLAVGLAAGETAVELVPFGLSFALLGPVSPGRDWRARLIAALPALGVVVGYVALYKLGGYGVAHSGEYVDPATSPFAFAFAALTRVPLFLADAVVLVPADFGVIFPVGPLIAVGVVAAAALALLYRACRPAIPEEERLALRWLVPGALLALLPGVGGFPGARLLLVADIGFAALFGALLPRAFARIAGQAGLVLWARRVGGGFLATLHFGFAPLLMIAATLNATRMARANESVAFDADLGSASRARAFVLAASDPMVAIYPPALIAVRSPERLSCWAVFSVAKSSHVLTRTGVSTFTLEPVGTTLLHGAFEKLYRPDDEPMQVGDGGEILRRDRPRRRASGREAFADCDRSRRAARVAGGAPARVEGGAAAPVEAPRGRRAGRARVESGTDGSSLSVWLTHRTTHRNTRT